MSENSESSFDQIINGESASTEDETVIQTLAVELIVDIPCEIIQEVQYTDPESGALVSIRKVVPEEGDGSVTFSGINIGYDDGENWNFTMTFNERNENINLFYPDDEDLLKAIGASNELINSEALDSKTLAVLTYVNSLMGFISGLTPMEAMQAQAQATGIDTTQVHVADAMRELVAETVGNKAVTVKEYGLELPSGTMLTIIEHGPINYSPEELAEFEVPILQVMLTEESGVTHRYVKHADGSTEYEFDTGDFQDTEAEDDIEEEAVIMAGEIGEFFEVLYADKLNTDAAHLFTDALVEATMIDMEEPSNPNQADQWTYPDMDFWFNADSFFEDHELSVDRIVKDGLRSLTEATERQLPELCEEYPPQPAYRYSTNQRVRIEKYLQQQVVRDGGQRKPSKLRAAYADENKDTRANIFDIHVACEMILDELSAENHPISQMIACLATEYGDVVGSVTTQYVVTEIIKQTQDRRLRNFYNATVHQWRTDLTTPTTDSIYT